MKREIIADSILIFSGVFFAFMFVMFRLGIYFHEPSHWIATLEIFLSLCVLGLGIERFINDVRSKR